MAIRAGNELRRESHSVLPSLRGLASLAFLSRFGRDPLLAARDLIARHGPIVAIHPVLGLPRAGRLTVLAAGARFNEAVLMRPELWLTGQLPTGGPPGTALHRLGQNVVSLNGPRHMSQRRPVAAALRRENVDAMGDEIVAKVGFCVAAWPLGNVDLWTLDQDLMRSVAVALLFGGDQHQGAQLATLVERLSRESKSLRTYLSRAGIPLGGLKRLFATAEEVEARAHTLAEGTHADAKGDLVAVLAAAADETGCPMTRERLAGALPVLFGASYESCQTALSWTLLLLAQHPDVANRLSREVKEASSDSPLRYETLKSLPWLDMVVKEGMRLFPPAPFQTRIASKELDLCGYNIPAGAYLLLSPFLTNRSPETYPDPDKFMPERWQTLRATAFEYPTFSAGPRLCPGTWFGIAVVKAALAAILSRYTIRLREGEQIDTQVAITMRPRRGLPATLCKVEEGWKAAPLTGQINRLVSFPTS